MACACKKSSGEVKAVKQVVKKVPSKVVEKQRTEQKTHMKKIIYRRPI